MTHFLCDRVRRGFLPCAQQCKDCRDTEDTTGPGPLPATAEPPRMLVCLDCGAARRHGGHYCAGCGGNAFVEARPLGLAPRPFDVPVGEAHELPGTKHTWDAFDVATITMDLMP